MEYCGTCRLCGERVCFEENKVYKLGEHLVLKHPELEMTYVAFRGNRGNSNGSLRSSKSCSKLSLGRKRSTSGKLGRKSTSGAKRKSSITRTSIETWSPGSHSMTCPSCGYKGHPYNRKQRNKVATNSMSAFFLLGCWPVCFLPMTMCGKYETLVCCRSCGYCFGKYDKKTRKLIPLCRPKKLKPPNV